VEKFFGLRPGHAPSVAGTRGHDPQGIRQARRRRQAGTDGERSAELLSFLRSLNQAIGSASNQQGRMKRASRMQLAGAALLLVSHWEVYSDATVKLIKASVREMARDPKVGRSEALRRSMLALIDKGELHEAHPAYWAPLLWSVRAAHRLSGSHPSIIGR
jgi:CHAT domain